jgi:hypothetical protein
MGKSAKGVDRIAYASIFRAQLRLIARLEIRQLR